MDELSDELIIAKDIIEQTGNYASEKQNENIHRMRKEGGSIVTEVDIKVQQMIEEELEEKTSYPVTGEENYNSEISNQDEYWLIDPIDGTSNYARGLPIYSCTACLIKEGEPYIGVAYAPEFNELFFAQKDKGCYLNSTKNPQKVSDRSEKISALCSGSQTSLMHTHFIRNTDWSYQRLHGAMYSGMTVASGRNELCVMAGLEPWDIATAYLAVLESGGKFETFNGEQSWDSIKNNYSVAWNGNESIEEKIASFNPDDMKS